MKYNKLYNEDCLLTMSKLEDNAIDLVITSPPYNMNLRILKGKYCSRQLVKEISTKYEEFSDNLPINEFYNFHKIVLQELLRVSKLIFYNISVVTGSKRAFFKLIGEYSDYLKDIIIWDKGVAQPAMLAGVLNRQSELILVFEKDNAISRKFSQAKFDRGTLSDTWKISRGTKIDASHGAVFPAELVEKILCNFSSEGEVIYDPFSGTGTTAVVSKRMNRRWIGSEINPNYVRLSETRLNSINHENNSK